MNDQNFVELCNRLAKIDLFGKLPPPPPWGKGSPSLRSEPIVRAKVDSSKDAIPDEYFEAFIAPLRIALPNLIKDATTKDPTTLEILAGAIYQHGPDYHLITPQLRRFLAVVSDLYRSFLDREKREKAGIRLSERLPPLAAFKYLGDRGPFTRPVDGVKHDIGGKVGVVSLPATYADHPLLWAAIAHETGGHDVVHADPGLIEELQRGVEKALLKTAVTGLDKEKLALLWAYWMDEAVADVYGLLNVGPAFGLNLAAYIAARRSKPQARPTPLDIPKISMASGSETNDQLNPHPTDILRIHLAIGVVENLNGLGQEKRNAYVGDLKQLAVRCASGNVIQIAGNVTVGKSKTMPIKAAVPLAEMQEAARQVGKYIATVKLRALRNHSIQEIETWDNDDEACAEAVRVALAAREPIVALGDDAHLLAGATMRLLEIPSDYDAVTKALADALDHSFKEDPIWGGRKPGSVAKVRAPSPSKRKPRRTGSQARKSKTSRPQARSRRR